MRNSFTVSWDNRSSAMTSEVGSVEGNSAAIGRPRALASSGALSMPGRDMPCSYRLHVPALIVAALATVAIVSPCDNRSFLRSFPNASRASDSRLRVATLATYQMERSTEEYVL